MKNLTVVILVYETMVTVGSGSSDQRAVMFASRFFNSVRREQGVLLAELFSIRFPVFSRLQKGSDFLRYVIKIPHQYHRKSVN